MGFVKRALHGIGKRWTEGESSGLRRFWEDLPLQGKATLVVAIPMTSLVVASVATIVFSARQDVVAAAVLATAGGGLAVLGLFTSSLVRRLERLEDAASRLAQGEFRPIADSANDEVGRLARVLHDASLLIDRQAAGIRASEQRLRTVVSNAPVMLFALDATGRFTFIEGRGGEFQIEPSDLIGRSVFEAFAGYPQVCNAVRMALAGHLEPFELEFDGVTVSIRANPVGGEGNFAGIIGVATDITLRRDAERELERKNRILEENRAELVLLAEFRQAIVDLMEESLQRGPDPGIYDAFLARLHAVVPGVQSSCLLLRRDDGRFEIVAGIGMDVEALRHGSVTHDAMDAFRGVGGADTAIVTSERWSAQRDEELVTLLTRAGRERPASVVVSVPIIIEGEMAAFLHLENATSDEAFDRLAIGMAETFATQIGVILKRFRLETELTTRQEEISRANVELERANRMKSQFVATMSHELRTPLTAIIGFSELLKEELYGPLNAKQLQYSRDIFDAGQHLLSLINDILDLTKIDAGRMEVNREMLDADETLRGVTSLFRERFLRAGVRLVSDESVGRGEEPIRFHADGRKVRQILVNLVSNALKFTPSGGTVRLAVERVGGDVVFAVEDSGIGIAAADLPKLFQDFSQVDSSFTRRHEGTGLGLALSRRLVALHEGRIWVESTPGIGSVFRFSLPAVPSDSLASTSSSGGTSS
jgi:PAS domain S-box-containing protein